MRYVIAVLIVVGLVVADLAAPASAALPTRIEFTSLDAVSK